MPARPSRTECPTEASQGVARTGRRGRGRVWLVGADNRGATRLLHTPARVTSNYGPEVLEPPSPPSHSSRSSSSLSLRSSLTAYPPIFLYYYPYSRFLSSASILHLFLFHNNHAHVLFISLLFSHLPTSSSLPRFPSFNLLLLPTFLHPSPDPNHPSVALELITPPTPNQITRGISSIDFPLPSPLPDLTRFSIYSPSSLLFFNFLSCFSPYTSIFPGYLLPHYLPVLSSPALRLCVFPSLLPSSHTPSNTLSHLLHHVLWRHASRGAHREQVAVVL